MTTTAPRPQALRLAWPFGTRQTRLPARPMPPPAAPALLWRAWCTPRPGGWWPARPLAG